MGQFSKHYVSFVIALFLYYLVQIVPKCCCSNMVLGALRKCRYLAQPIKKIIIWWNLCTQIKQLYTSCMNSWIYNNINIWSIVSTRASMPFGVHHFNFVCVMGNVLQWMVRSWNWQCNEIGEGASLLVIINAGKY